MRRVGSLPGLSGWTALGLTVLSVALTLAAVAAGAWVRSVQGGISFEQAIDAIAIDPLTLGLAQAFGFGTVLIALLSREGRDESVSEALSIRPVRTRLVLLSLVLGAALCFVLGELGNAIEELAPHSLDDRLRMAELLTPSSPLDGVALVLATVLVAPVAEELLFRGVILDGLATRYGALDGLVLSSMLFGLSHRDSTASIVALAGGLVLGLVALRTRSVIPSIALHAAFNGTRVLLPERLVAIEGFNTVHERVTHLSPGLWGPAALVALGALHLVFVTTRDDPAP